MAGESKKYAKPAVTFSITLTSELRETLDALAGSYKVGPTIERLLREIPEVIAQRDKLGLKWRMRRPSGYQGHDEQVQELGKYQ